MNFTLGWTSNRSTSGQTNVTSDLDLAFVYKDSTELNSYPYFGIYSNYYGGGYLFKMNGNRSRIERNLDALQRAAWIDRQTRAIIIEFSIFNPNVQLFSHCMILFEFLPTGIILKQMRFNPLNLFDFNSNLSHVSFRLATHIVYILFIVYFVWHNLKLAFKFKLAYLRRFWSYCEMAIILFSLAGFVIYLNRLNDTYNMKELIRNLDNSNSYFRLQAFSYWNDLYQLCLGVCTFLGTLKLLKLLRFNRRIGIFLKSIKLSFEDLFGFSVLFVIVWFSFVQLFFLIFHANESYFSSIIKTVQTCFKMMIGNLNNVDNMFYTNKKIGSLVFTLFNILIVFTFLNMFFSILNRTYAKVKYESQNMNEDEPEPLSYLGEKFIYFADKLRRRNRNQIGSNGTINYDHYQDGVTHFPKKIEELVNLLLKVMENF